MSETDNIKQKSNKTSAPMFNSFRNCKKFVSDHFTFLRLILDMQLHSHGHLSQ
jgi:hypothetical protein